MTRSLVALLCASIVLPGIAEHDSSTASAQANPSPARTWQLMSQSVTAPSFLNPSGIAVDGSGNVYVGDSGHDQIQKLSPSGARLAVFGSYGWRPGHFRDPTNVQVDRWGNIYVFDARNYRIQKLSPFGRPLAEIQLPTFSWFGSMAVDPWGQIYLSSYDLIRKFSSSGAVLETWRGRGGPLATDRSGNIFVANHWEYNPATRSGAQFIYKLSPHDAVLNRWSEDQLNPVYPTSLAVDARGYIYLIDANTTRVIKLSPSGTVSMTWGGPSHRQYRALGGLAVDAAGSVYVTDSTKQHVKKLSAAGGVLAVWGTHGTSASHYKLPGGVAVDRQGNVYIADTWNDRIQKRSPSGALLRQWGTRGHARGQFEKPTTVLVNRQGRIVVADYGNSRLQIFSPNGRLIRIVKVPGPHFVYGTEPYGPYFYFGPYSSQAALGLALDGQGNFIISDPSGSQVFKLSARGKILATYSQWVTGRQSSPGGVAVDAADNIYVADPGTAHVVKLSPSGHRIAVWGRFGYVGAGVFNRPFGIAVDADGNIYVSDIGNHCIQELSPSGRPVRAWGTLGSGRGQFTFPEGIAVGGDGVVYVADTWNNRIQKLAPAAVDDRQLP